MKCALQTRSHLLLSTHKNDFHLDSVVSVPFLWAASLSEKTQVLSLVTSSITFIRSPHEDGKCDRQSVCEHPGQVSVNYMWNTSTKTGGSVVVKALRY